MEMFRVSSSTEMKHQVSDRNIVAECPSVIHWWAKN